MTKFSEVTHKDKLTSIFYLIAFIIIITASSFLLMPRYTLVWLMIVFGMVFFLIWWNTTHFGYGCKKCNHQFEISYFKNCISPHGVGMDGAWKFLRCPSCKKFSCAKVLKKEK